MIWLNKRREQQKWLPYVERYTKGEWRAQIFHDMVLADAEILKKQNGHLTILDIGCGGGFDGDAKLQHSIAEVAEQYIGIEPDEAIKLENIYSAIHRCIFENAPLAPESIDLAIAVMVLEHINNPKTFWDKLYSILKHGGIFWGFTVDARHFFVLASCFMEKLGIKDWYLNSLHGDRVEKRYENYPVYYKVNTPKKIQKMTSSFSSCITINFHRVGQMNYYFPKKLRWIGRTLDYITIRLGLPGSIMAVRVEK